MFSKDVSCRCRGALVIWKNHLALTKIDSRQYNVRIVAKLKLTNIENMTMSSLRKSMWAAILAERVTTAFPSVNLAQFDRPAHGIDTWFFCFPLLT